MDITVLFDGFPGRSSRGFLGWSSCVLIRREGERPILFDTLGFNERYTLLERLNQAGVSPDEIGTVLLSHFHFDHAVNYPLFPNATFYLHEKEVAHIAENGKKDLAVPVEMFPALRDCGRLEILSGTSGIVEGLNWLHTPGHTPGLYSILVDYQGEKWAIVSDTIKNRQELSTGEVSMTWDDAKSKESIEAIKEWADIVVPGHDQLLRVHRSGKNAEIVPVNESVLNVIVPWLDKTFTIKA
ncbi:MBL fold metallo-hydrolase [Brevibacillus composti]|uniref:MBL fold metallo-hydrolase n=1 Tax=Brevibacillus composti TaxID=2796470 RepID=A0A7T5EKN9_9BACL|nr:MBL fold metallo-hydrolase [Brevibacillus composti]QQE74394.1 MBL fold metallo-hydrolase [Brevibacillus composti]QUO41476.1 MBL fold metallo-hydrolase [Brevibacillus composti]